MYDVYFPLKLYLDPGASVSVALSNIMESTIKNSSIVIITYLFTSGNLGKVVK